MDRKPLIYLGATFGMVALSAHVADGAVMESEKKDSQAIGYSASVGSATSTDAATLFSETILGQEIRAPGPLAQTRSYFIPKIKL